MSLYATTLSPPPMPRLLLGALALLLAVPAQAQWVEDALPAPDAEAPPSEGIQVHGHWTITVRNADGSVAERREFENALEAFGSYLLVYLLDGRATRLDDSTWNVLINNFDVFEASTSIDTPDDNPFSNFSNFMLVSSIKRNGSLTINRVGTQLNNIVINGGITDVEFTSKFLDPSIQVAPGQTVDVLVEITFE